jgi:hypothetical protein
MTKLKAEQKDIIDRFDRDCYDKYSIMLNNPNGPTMTPGGHVHTTSMVNNRHSICNVNPSQIPNASSSNMKHYFSLFNDRSASITADFGNASANSSITTSPQANNTSISSNSSRQSKLFNMSATPSHFMNQSSLMNDLDSSSSSTLSLQSSSAVIANGSGLASANGQYHHFPATQLVYYAQSAGVQANNMAYYAQMTGSPHIQQQQQQPQPVVYHQMNEQFMSRGASGKSNGSSGTTGASSGSSSTPMNRRNSTAFN